MIRKQKTKERRGHIYICMYVTTEKNIQYKRIGVDNDLILTDNMFTINNNKYISTLKILKKKRIKLM